MASRPDSQIRKRLNRLAGQVSGLQKMVQEGRYCVDILTQVSAARAAMDAFAVAVLCDHVEHCLDPAKHQAHPQAKAMSHDALVAELRESLSRLVK